jgi:hypothetical protein
MNMNTRKRLARLGLALGLLAGGMIGTQPLAAAKTDHGGGGHSGDGRSGGGHSSTRPDNGWRTDPNTGKHFKIDDEP